ADGLLAAVDHVAYVGGADRAGPREQVTQRERRGGLAREVLQQDLAGERVVLVVAGQHGAQEPAAGAHQRHRVMPLDAFGQPGARGPGRYRRTARLATDHGMTVERRPRLIGDLAIEGEQIEAVAGGEKAQEFVLRHDLAVRTEPRRASEGV